MSYSIISCHKITLNNINMTINVIKSCLLVNKLMYKIFFEKHNKNMFKQDKFKKVGIGFVSGIISGLFAAGGGMIALPALIHIFKMKETEARATSVFVILPMAITSGFFYYNSNYIDWNLWIKCAIGGIIRRNNRSNIA